MIDLRTAGKPAVRDRTGLTRRGLLMGAAALSCAGALSARAETLRIAAIDWAMLETALAIGVTPVSAAELKQFQAAAAEPPLPDGVADLGLRGSLNYEQLLASRPDLILVSPWYENRRAALERIAPVESFAIYDAGKSPYDAAVDVTRALGARLGRTAQAETAIVDINASIAAAKTSIARFEGRRVLVMNLGDARHFRAFGPDSMFGNVLARLGLVSAWTQTTQFGAYPTVGVEALAGLDDAIVLNVGPTPPSALAETATSPLWRAMPPIAAGRLVTIDPVNPYGALPAARRFARLAAEGLSRLSDA